MSKVLFTFPKYIFFIIGVPKYYDSFRISESESVLLMQKLGDCLFGILEKEQRKCFPIPVVAAIAINLVSLSTIKARSVINFCFLDKIVGNSEGNPRCRLCSL
jgi:hypothetical protein